MMAGQEGRQNKKASLVGTLEILKTGASIFTHKFMLLITLFKNGNFRLAREYTVKVLVWPAATARQTWLES